MNSIPAMVCQRAAERGSATVFRRKDRGIWKAISWAELGARMREMAQGLRAVGFHPGDVAAVLAETRPEWVYADLGILGAGGVSAGIYATDDTAHVAHVLCDCGARILFVENEEQLDKALAARTECPTLQRIVIFDMKGLRDLAEPMCESLADFVARGAEHDRGHPGSWEDGLAAIERDRPAALVYTVGTTGTPKGVTLSHHNILFQIENAARLLGIRDGDERLAFMPMGHVMERVLGVYLSLHAGVVSNYVESPETVAENLQEVKPTVLMAAPHVWEKFHSRVAVATASASLLQRLLYRWALAAGAREASAQLAGRRPPALVLTEAWILRWLVLGNVRRELGLSRLRLGLVGAAPVSPDLIRWFMALGIDLIEFYGQAECGGLTAVMPVAAPRLGMAGRPVPYGEIALSAEGEILVRGEHVFIGYWGRPETTELTLQDDWLRTGDLGAIEDSYVRIVGRKQEQITTASGHQVTAAEIEAALKLSPYIADAAVFGDGRAFLSCLVMLDHESVERWARSNGVAFTSFGSLVRSEPLQTLLASEIERTNAQHPVGIRSFRLLEERLEPEDPELTPMMKLRRGFVGEKYRALIEEMYYSP